MHYLTVFQPFKCPHCFIVYRSQAKFYFHKRLAHGIGKPVICQGCGSRSFTGETTFRKHVKKCTSGNRKLRFKITGERIVSPVLPEPETLPSLPPPPPQDGAASPAKAVSARGGGVGANTRSTGKKRQKKGVASATGGEPQPAVDDDDVSSAAESDKDDDDVSCVWY